MDEEPVEVPTLDALVEIRVPEPVSNAPATPAWIRKYRCATPIRNSCAALPTYSSV